MSRGGNTSGVRALKIGHRFGRAIVIRLFVHRKIPHAECICFECGEFFTAPQTKIRTEKTKACTKCARAMAPKRGPSKPPEETRLVTAECGYRYSAIKRGHPWHLTRQNFRELVTSPCTYCGLHPAKGIDRQDSAQGYTTDNSASCCKQCNYAKRSQTVEQFLDWVARIAAKQGFCL